MDNSLALKVHTNLGITLEAQGLLRAACGHYRSVADCIPETLVTLSAQRGYNTEPMQKTRRTGCVSTSCMSYTFLSVWFSAALA